MHGPVKALLLDAFGTMCEIRDRRSPFVRLTRHFSDRKAWLKNTLTSRSTLADIALKLHLSDAYMAELEKDLEAELSSITMFQDALELMTFARRRGVRIGVVSNLAMPYGDALRRHFPFEPDCCVWSYSVGALKPDSRMFSTACEMLNVQARDTLMVGDSFVCDFQGAVGFGMNALLLQRVGSPPEGIPTIRTLHEVLPVLAKTAC
jgi:HAD superfamily hydrolase (TIGR01549 family)